VFILQFGIATADNGAIKATTEDGRTVILYPEGIWEYVTSERMLEGSSDSFNKPSDATSAIKSKKGFVEVWYDPAKWNLLPSNPNDDAEFMFEHQAEDCYALVIVERISMSLEALRDIAVENARVAGHNVRVVDEEIREINGQRMLVMGVEGIIEGILFRYHGCYWTGQSGAVQVVAFTGGNLFTEYEQDITDLLNGTIILSD
jgi:hypothetical protein